MTITYKEYSGAVGLIDMPDSPEHRGQRTLLNGNTPPHEQSEDPFLLIVALTIWMDRLCSGNHSRNRTRTTRIREKPAMLLPRVDKYVCTFYKIPFIGINVHARFGRGERLAMTISNIIFIVTMTINEYLPTVIP
jgi:hypothetical protein